MADGQHLGEAGIHLELGGEVTHHQGKKEQNNKYRQTQAEYEIFNTLQNNLPFSGRAVFLRRLHRSAQDVAEFPAFLCLGDRALQKGLCGRFDPDGCPAKVDRGPASRRPGRAVPSASGVIETPGAQAALSITPVEIGTVINMRGAGPQPEMDAGNSYLFQMFVSLLRNPAHGRTTSVMVNDPATKRTPPRITGTPPRRRDATR